MLQKNEKKYSHSFKPNISLPHKRSVKTFRILVERAYFELFDSFWRYEFSEDSLWENAEKHMSSIMSIIIMSTSSALFAKQLLALNQKIFAKKYLKKQKNNDSSSKNIPSQYLENVKIVPYYNYLYYEYHFFTLSTFHLIHWLDEWQEFHHNLSSSFLRDTLFEQ